MINYNTMDLFSYSSDEINPPSSRWRSEDQEILAGRLEFIRATPDKWRTKK